MVYNRILSLSGNEYDAYRESCEKHFNATGQYSRQNSLLFEFLLKVPRNLHGFKFSKYVVRELNKLFPHLRISLRDIDASHILYFSDPEEKKLPVVIVKFVSRDLRNSIYRNRHILRTHRCDHIRAPYSDQLTAA